MLLNYVDLIVGPNGEYMTIDERLQDIANRYGVLSIQYKKAKKLSEFILTTFLPQLRQDFSGV